MQNTFKSETIHDYVERRWLRLVISQRLLLEPTNFDDYSLAKDEKQKDEIFLGHLEGVEKGEEHNATQFQREQLFY